VESVNAEDDELAVGVLEAGGRREHYWAMVGVGGMGHSLLRKRLIHIVAAAGPSIAVGSAVAAADNTDQDIRMTAAGQSNLLR